MSDFTASEWDPAISRFFYAMLELRRSLEELGVVPNEGPIDCYLCFGSETFNALYHELTTRPNILHSFTRPHRKKADKNAVRSMISGIQFGNRQGLEQALVGLPFWPATAKIEFQFYAFSGPRCPFKTSQMADGTEGTFDAEVPF